MIQVKLLNPMGLLPIFSTLCVDLSGIPLGRKIPYSGKAQKKGVALVRLLKRWDVGNHAPSEGAQTHQRG